MTYTKKIVKCLRGLVRVYIGSDGYWFPVRDICKVLNCAEDKFKEPLLKMWDDEDYFEIKHVEGRGLECVSADGVHEGCRLMDNDISHQMLEWVSKLHIPLEVTIADQSKLEQLVRLKELVEYFGIDPQDVRVGKVVNEILD